MDHGSGERGSPPLLDRVVGLEGDVRLDPSVDRLASLAGSRVGQGRARDVLGGRWLGHSVHPVLTDLPLGFWTAATTLDWVGGRASERAARRLVGLGVLAAVPTALTGLSDWTALRRPAQRVGVVHAVANTAALVCYSASWLSRRRGHRQRGRVYALGGAAAAGLGGFLGGHLAIARGVGVEATEQLVDLPPVVEADGERSTGTDVPGPATVSPGDDG